MKQMIAYVLVLALSLTGCVAAEVVVAEKDGVAYFQHSGKTPEITIAGRETAKIEKEYFFEMLTKTIDGKPITHEVCSCEEAEYRVYVDEYVFLLHTHGIAIYEKYGPDINGLIDVGVVVCSRDEMKTLFSMLEADK